MKLTEGTKATSDFVLKDKNLLDRKPDLKVCANHCDVIRNPIGRWWDSKTHGEARVIDVYDWYITKQQYEAIWKENLTKGIPDEPA